MKTKIAIFLLLLIALSVTLVACNDEPEELCNHKWTIGEVTTEPTCLTDGVRVKTCVLCEKTQEVAEPAVGEHLWDGGAVTSAPTCGKDGVTTYNCTSCDATKTEPIAATGMHTFSDEETVIKEPTCGEQGTRSRTCETCGYERIYVTPSTGEHVEGDVPVAASDIHYIPCAVCGKALSEERHTWDEGTVIVSPDGCKPGLKEAACTVCKHKSEVMVASNTPHTVTSSIDKENSTVTYRCSKCAQTYTYSLKFLYDYDETQTTLSLMDGDGNTLTQETELATWIKTNRGNSYQAIVRHDDRPANDRATQAQNNSGLVSSNAIDAVISIDVMSASTTNTSAKFMFSFYNSAGSWSDGSRGIQFFQILGNNICTNTAASIGTISTNGWTNIRMEIQMVDDTFVVKYFVNNVYKVTRTFANTLLNDSYNVIYLNSNVYDKNTGFYMDNFFFGSK